MAIAPTLGLKTNNADAEPRQQQRCHGTSTLTAAAASCKHSEQTQPMAAAAVTAGTCARSLEMQRYMLMEENECWAGTRPWRPLSRELIGTSRTPVGSPLHGATSWQWTDTPRVMFPLQSISGTEWQRSAMNYKQKPGCFRSQDSLGRHTSAPAALLNHYSANEKLKN